MSQLWRVKRPTRRCAGLAVAEQLQMRTETLGDASRVEVAS